MSTPFIRFPGVAGNNVSTADTNLLTSDQGNLQQANPWGSVGGATSIILTGARAVFGSNSGQATANGAETLKVRWGTHAAGTNPAVGASQEITAIARVGSGASLREARWTLVPRDSGGSSLGAVFGSWVALGDNLEASTVYTITTPAGTASVEGWLEMQVAGGGSPTNGDLFYWDAVCLRLDDVSSFVPSLNVVGSSFVSEDASVTPVTYTFTPGSPLVLGEGYSGDVRQWALHDGPDASAPAVAQMLALDAARATVL